MFFIARVGRRGALPPFAKKAKNRTPWCMGGSRVGHQASYRPVSTVSFSPIALVTATSVDHLGLPRADSARYRLSRSTPAAFATFATPPLASATRRKAIKRTSLRPYLRAPLSDIRRRTQGACAVPSPLRHRARCWHLVSRLGCPFLVILKAFNGLSIKQLGVIYIYSFASRESQGSFTVSAIYSPIAYNR